MAVTVFGSPSDPHDDGLDGMARIADPDLVLKWLAKEDKRRRPRAAHVDDVEFPAQGLLDRLKDTRLADWDFNFKGV